MLSLFLQLVPLYNLLIIIPLSLLESITRRGRYTSVTFLQRSLSRTLYFSILFLNERNSLRLIPLGLSRVIRNLVISQYYPLYLVSRQSKGILINKAVPSSILLLYSKVNKKRLSTRGLSVAILALILTLPSTNPFLFTFLIQLIYTQSSSIVINSSISISFLLLILSNRVRGFLNSLSVAEYTLSRIYLTLKLNS